MLVHELAIEFEPELLDRIGPGCVGRQGQQADLAVDARKIVQYISVKVVGPVIQRDVNHAGVRIMLLDMIQEAVHLLDGKGLSSPDDDLAGCYIESTCQPGQTGSRSTGWLTFVPNR